MHRLSVLLLIAVMSGCSSSSVTIDVKDKESGKPLEGIRIKRYQPVSLIEKIVNPVGTTYHPFNLAETIVTDANGQATFRELTARDKFQIYSKDARTLLVTAWEKEVSLSPETNQPPAQKWGYSVRLESGKVEYSAWPVEEQ
ncbi:MAG: hypothetical protein BWX84_01959 [Verrucomicrobia bacterium ADurb.Bin118]|jgi:hypothetical protein|nr:MAG: hypothetical protein BWX84_01959 [Verrucomicrobia bacterium ADurb.Bin118]